MKSDKETKQRILSSAKKEFMEKGYMQASLRNICKNAGVTTGALYFFFKDKEDVFASLVEAPLEKLFTVMQLHFSEELVRTDKPYEEWDDFSADQAAAQQIVHYLYQHHDEFYLILMKSQGSRFEGTVDEFIAITEKHYRVMADQIAVMMGGAGIEDYMVHWFAHMSLDTFVHLLLHEKSESEALVHMKSIVKFLTSGWMAMFQK